MCQHLELRTKALITCLAVGVSLLCCVRASAATFADYRRRVSEAITVIEQLQAVYDNEDSSSREHFNNSVARIRGALPVKETVTLDAQSVVVDNTWLHEALQDYEKTSNSKLQRADALARMGERLRALDEQLQDAQIIVVLACLIAIAFLIWKFGPRYLSNRRKKKKTLEARIVLGERLEPDQTSADLLAQAEMLARNGDLRAAIRKAYIALLCELGDRKVVSLAQHKTNRDYLNSVRERTLLYNSMRKLTSSFELHWYGFQPAAESDWLEFRNRYQQALKAGSGG